MAKISILVVEDNMIIATDIKERLEGFGYKIAATASSGEQAISKASLLKPDLIIMDIGLKGKMNGIEAANKIHESLSIPIIYLTGNSELLRQANSKEPFGFINKPFEEKELNRLIVSLMSNPKQKQLNGIY